MFVWRLSPVRTSSASTRTPTSIDVCHAALTEACRVSSSPTWTGSRNVIRSTAAVTTRPPLWRTAARPAASSQSFITVPPWTNPAEFASSRPIHLTRIERERVTGRGSMAR